MEQRFSFERCERVAETLGPPEWETLEQVMEELPQGISRLWSWKDTADLEKYQNKPQHMYAPGEACQNCGDVVEKYDGELCRAYREEIDTLLVFAGLFSAVLTGFSVESYQWLQDDPNDAMVEILARIAQSLLPDANSSTSAMPKTSGIPRSVSTRINAYWFVSLALSLATALVAILAKQWVREFERHAAMPPKTSVAVRQVKFEGLHHWRVGDIISALPLLLQLSLALFSLGILELLWHLEAAVAIAVCIPVVVTVLFYLVTTFLPVLQFSQSISHRHHMPECAYKSPQAWLAMQGYQMVARTWDDVSRSGAYARLCRSFHVYARKLGIRSVHEEQDDFRPPRRWTPSWSDWDRQFTELHDKSLPDNLPSSYFRALSWIVKNVDNSKTKESVWHCLWEEANAPSRDDPEDPDWLHRKILGLWHAFHLKEIDVGKRLKSWILPAADPRSCTIISGLRANLGSEFLSELLVQNLMFIGDPAAANALVSWTGYWFSSDACLVASFVRVAAEYCRGRFHEDVGDIVGNAGVILLNCSDPQTRSALRRCTVLMAQNWLRLRAHSHYTPAIFEPIRKAVIGILGNLARDLDDFVRHPSRLNSVEHVQEYASLVKAYCEVHGMIVTWPLVDINFDTLDIEPDVWRTVAVELLKISVCGIDPGHVAEFTATERGSEPRDDQHSTTARTASPVPGHLLSTATVQRINTPRHATDAPGSSHSFAGMPSVLPASPNDLSLPVPSHVTPGAPSLEASSHQETHPTEHNGEAVPPWAAEKPTTRPFAQLQDQVQEAEVSTFSDDPENGRYRLAHSIGPEGLPGSQVESAVQVSRASHVLLGADQEPSHNMGSIGTIDSTSMCDGPGMSTLPPHNSGHCYSSFQLEADDGA